MADERQPSQLHEKQLAFLEWIVDPQRQGSERQWAIDNGVHRNTLRAWKKLPAFRRELEARAAELNVDPERIQNVVNAIYQSACAGDVRAAQLYLQYVDRFTPKSIVVTEDEGFKRLSDEELAAETEAAVRSLRAV